MWVVLLLGLHSFDSLGDSSGADCSFLVWENWWALLVLQKEMKMCLPVLGSGGWNSVTYRGPWLLSFSLICISERFKTLRLFKTVSWLIWIPFKLCNMVFAYRDAGIAEIIQYLLICRVVIPKKISLSLSTSVFPRFF